MKHAGYGVALLAIATSAFQPLAAKHSTCPLDRPGVAQLSASETLQANVLQVGPDRVLVLEGGIDAKAPETIAGALRSAGAISEIWLRSPGGNAAAGNRAGEVIRRSGIPVRIRDGWWCISACNFLFFGGALRTIDPGGVFAVHMATRVNDPNYQSNVARLTKRGATGSVLEEIAKREQGMAQLTADDIDVMLRMGISRKLLSDVMYAQRADSFRGGRDDAANAETYRCLTREEMVRYNVVNID